MTADTVQAKLTAKRAATPPLRAPVRPAIKKSLTGRPLELTRDQDFLNGQDDIFDVLARHSAEKENWDSRMNATLLLLQRTRSMLSDAEHTIQDLTEKLRYLEDVSGICALTGLLNRVGFSRALLREVARTNRGLSTGGLLVMFNLENLASIENDHGPKAVEAALRLIARALESEMRDMDFAARVQNDEFVLLFAHTTMDKALSRLQTMALRLNKVSMIWNNHEINMSLSLGLKSFAAGDRPDQIFQCASDDLARNRKNAKHP
jgi:diguanylate cyclase (GGDEF)-like protein